MMSGFIAMPSMRDIRDLEQRILALEKKIERLEKLLEVEPSITCPKCGRTSHNSNDVEQGWCITCADWTSGQRIAQEEARQRANPPAPGAMQGDAGPEHDRYMERIRDPDGHD
jgi:hypothetical protein